uniref:Uncharacterized protein n=1 Tax=Orbilia brochopaga TaxID=3140254 RepID=A0A481ZMP1_9PEZI|nr:hypothetical protein [Drechslerella brochopaga]YP_009568492.1 hypothetical protein [Drechslerella brochopaga]QBL02504.1 hypothetical protein [Drechslerella brochopaga]QBL02572.1 hypothetical protein [Drechslerella brochopaga]
MIILSSCYLLLINAVTSRRDKTLSHNRITTLILLYSTFLALNSLHMTCLETGIGVYGVLLLALCFITLYLLFIIFNIFYLYNYNTLVLYYFFKLSKMSIFYFFIFDSWYKLYFGVNINYVFSLFSYAGSSPITKNTLRGVIALTSTPLKMVLYSSNSLSKIIMLLHQLFHCKFIIPVSLIFSAGLFIFIFDYFTSLSENFLSLHMLNFINYDIYDRQSITFLFLIKNVNNIKFQNIHKYHARFFSSTAALNYIVAAAKVYTNAHIQKIQIISDNKGKSGDLSMN